MADDEVFNRHALKLMIKLVVEADVCEEAVDGQQAVDKVKSDLVQNGMCSYTHIFIDQNMPIKDGLTATREIRELICQNNF